MKIKIEKKEAVSILLSLFILAILTTPIIYAASIIISPQEQIAGQNINIKINAGGAGVYQYSYIYSEDVLKDTIVLCDTSVCRGSLTKNYTIPLNFVPGIYNFVYYDYSTYTWLKENFTVSSFAVSAGITFYRIVECHKCSQHKVPPLTEIKMTTKASFSGSLSNVKFVEYFPKEWQIIDAAGGIVGDYDNEFNKIEWQVESASGGISKTYNIKSPERTMPATKYNFQNQLENEKSNLWMIIVADPARTIEVLHPIVHANSRLAGTQLTAAQVQLLSADDNQRLTISRGQVLVVEMQNTIEPIGTLYNANCTLFYYNQAGITAGSLFNVSEMYNGRIIASMQIPSYTGPNDNFIRLINLQLQPIPLTPTNIQTMVVVVHNKDTGSVQRIYVDEIKCEIEYAPVLVCVDADGDSYNVTGGECGLIDCNDANPSINPGAAELCNGIDDDCDTIVPSNENDADADTYRICQNDCDDSNANIHPGATELCNNIDDDCDTSIDESLTQGCGSGACFGTQTCSFGSWGTCSSSGNDCGTCCNCDVSGTETYDSAQNADCSPTLCPADDCGVGGCGLNIFGDYPISVLNICSALFTCTSNSCTATCQADNDADSYSSGCGDCNDNNAAINPLEIEICNGLDDNCDSFIDNGLTPPLCELQIGVCNGAVKTCGSTSGWLSCDASDYGADFEAQESRCNDGLDNDCDGECDYDSSVCSHGDSSCAVEVTAITVSNPAPIENTNIEVRCTSSVANANSISAKIETTLCTWTSWQGNDAVFSCNAGAAGTKTITCFIDTSKSYQTGTNKTTTINVLPSSCSAYSVQGVCDADSRCDWCEKCSNSKWSGLANNLCVDTGTCNYYCWSGECNALCDETQGGCTDTVCDDYCSGNQLYARNNVANSCQIDCSCTSNACSLGISTSCGNVSCNAPYMVGECENPCNDIGTANDGTDAYCGTCTPTCSCVGGYANCNSITTDGCEVNLGLDENNCGSCGNVCSFANAIAQCSSETCTLQSCNSGFYNLDGNNANGCEYACEITNGGIESCDYIDNNCNGLVDENCGIAIIANNFSGRTTNFSAVDLSNFTLVLENEYGMINFTEPISFGNKTYDFDSNVLITYPTVVINTTALSELANKQATIHFYNISLIIPLLKKAGRTCPDCLILSYNRTEKTLIASVPGFSSYTLEENTFFGLGIALIFVIISLIIYYFARKSNRKKKVKLKEKEIKIKRQKKYGRKR